MSHQLTRAATAFLFLACKAGATTPQDGGTSDTSARDARTFFDGGTPDDCFGAESCNPTGDPIGGGDGYSKVLTSGDHTVGTRTELEAALQAAVAGEVVYVSDGVTIDLSGAGTLKIDDGVTLAGNRGSAGAVGPLLTTDDAEYMFRLEDDSRITGLRIKGPDVDFKDISYPISPFPSSPVQSNAKCLSLSGDRVEVDNLELSNYHRVGVDVQKGQRTHIHHNYLHDIHAYPVLVTDSPRMPLTIEANRIEWIWHAVGATGGPESGYETRYNVFVGKPIPTEWYSRGSHALDMHPDADIRSSRGDYVAGNEMIGHHNTFLDESGMVIDFKLEDVKIRGTTRNLARFYNNEFQNVDETRAVSFMLEGSGADILEPGNVWVYNNKFGSSKTLIDLSDVTRPLIRFLTPAPPDIEVPMLTGIIAVDFEIAHHGSLTTKSVSVTLDDSSLFAEARDPSAGEITIDTATLSPGLHRLTVRVTDSRDIVGTHATVFQTP